MAKITLVTPILSDPGASVWRVSKLVLDIQSPQIQITLAEADSNGFLPHPARQFMYTYKGSIAADLLKSLNRANLSTLSLQTRIINKLVADGVLGVGTIDTSDEV